MRDVSIYNYNDLRRYVDNDNFGLLLDTANAKYNEAIWRKYATWGTPSDDKEWIQGQKETPILVRASVLSTHGTKPQRSTEGWKYYGGSIAKIGHGFSIDEDDLFAMRKASKLQGIPYANLMTDTLIQNSANMLGGIHAELNYMVLQALSTGAINDIAVDGGRYDFRFPIADNHFIKPDKMWFSADGSEKAEATNVIKDILDMQEYLTDSLGLAVDHWKMSKKLFKKILRHSSVLSSIKARANYYNPDDVNLTDAEIVAALHANGVWPIDVIDYKSRHEVDGKPVTDAPAFDEHVMAAYNSGLVPFEMKCTNSIYLDRQSMGGIGTNHNYSFVEGRIAVLTSWEERPIKNIVDCELYAAPVFNNLNELAIATVWEKE